jgi:hypothetical protein
MIVIVCNKREAFVHESAAKQSIERQKQVWIASAFALRATADKSSQVLPCANALRLSQAMTVGNC